jgi:hypothetical protein
LVAIAGSELARRRSLSAEQIRSNVDEALKVLPQSEVLRILAFHHAGVRAKLFK